MIDIDPSTEFGARVLRRLAEERIVWLTTVRADGQPVPSPVWFLWDGETFLIYSQRGAPKVRNIAARPRVSLNFNTDAVGDDVVVIAGEARVADGEPTLDRVPPYLEKYEGAWPADMTPERAAAEYSLPIRVRPTKVRGF